MITVKKPLPKAPAQSTPPHVPPRHLPSPQIWYQLQAAYEGYDD
jgi:hypothetical protein